MTDTSLEALEKDVLIHLAYDRQELIKVLAAFCVELQPIAMDEETIDIRISHEIYEEIFNLLESFGFMLDTEVEDDGKLLPKD